jgi:hypothetical protein
MRRMSRRPTSPRAATPSARNRASSLGLRWRPANSASAGFSPVEVRGGVRLAAPKRVLCLPSPRQASRSSRGGAGLVSLPGLAGSRSGRNAGPAGDAKAYRPSMLMCLSASGESRAASASSTSPVARSGRARRRCSELFHSATALRTRPSARPTRQFEFRAKSGADRSRWRRRGGRAVERSASGRRARRCALTSRRIQTLVVRVWCRHWPGCAAGRRGSAGQAGHGEVNAPVTCGAIGYAILFNGCLAR